MAQPKKRDELEGRFRRLMARAERSQRDALVRAMGWPPDPANIPEPVIAKLEAEIADSVERTYLLMYMLALGGMSDDFDYLSDEDDAAAMAAEYAQSRAEFLAESVVSTTIERLSVIAAEVSLVEPKQQRPTWSSLTDSLFDGTRPLLIATTEVSHATTSGEKGFQQLAEPDIGTMEAFWVHRFPSVPGRHPCPKICEKLVDQPSILWPDIVPDYPDAWFGPPAHPNCDCALEWRILTKAELEEYGILT